MRTTLAIAAVVAQVCVIPNLQTPNFQLSVSPSLQILAQAPDWFQWRGPNRDGQSAETGLLKDWPAGGPKLLWRATGAGTGYSSF